MHSVYVYYYSGGSGYYKAECSECGIAEANYWPLQTSRLLVVRGFDDLSLHSRSLYTCGPQ